MQHCEKIYLVYILNYTILHIKYIYILILTFSKVNMNSNDTAATTHVLFFKIKPLSRQY